jgi:hypothetical protein
LGSTGAPAADKHLPRRALKRETKKQAHAAAKQASVDKFSRPPRLSIEFAFIILLRDRCMELVGQHTGRLLEAYHHGDRALPPQLLRRSSSSGFLRHVVMQLAQFRNGPGNDEARFRIVMRVVAQRCARTPEVRLSFRLSYCFFFVLNLLQSDFEQGHRAWTAGQCRAAIACFERAIDGGHVRAHGALAWIRARFTRPCQLLWSGRSSNGVKSFVERTLELAKKGSTLGCR